MHVPHDNLSLLAQNVDDVTGTHKYARIAMILKSVFMLANYCFSLGFGVWGLGFGVWGLEIGRAHV